MHSRCLALLLIIISTPSWSAVVTYWDRVGVAGSDKFASGIEACNAYRGEYYGQTWDHVQTSSTEWVCRFNNPFEFMGYARSYTVVEETLPGGQSCQRDGTANTGFGFVTNAAGECVDWTRADLPSQCKSLAGTGVPKKMYVSFNGDGSAQTPPPLNIGGCHAVPGPTGHCQKSPVKTWPTGGTFQSDFSECMVYVSFTGDVTSGGSVAPPVVTGPGADGVCDPDANCADIPDAPVANERQQCTYVYDGEGRRVCTSHDYNYIPGQTSCGTVNGQFQCIGKAPETNGITIGTTVDEKQNADGSTTTTKTDTIEQVTCVGANACTSTTTKNSTVVIKDGAGNTVSQSGSCTGPLCAPDGKGDKDGDGVKDCIGPRCAEDGEEGEDDEFSGPENDEVGGFDETTSAFMSRLNGAPLVAAAKNLSFGGGGSCQFGSFTVPILGTLSFQPVCAWAAEWLAPLRAIMLAVWALLAVRVFLEA